MPPALTIFLIICFLESAVLVVQAAASAAGCSSSCGEIGSIRYPFRLKGDPSECGDPDYELLCRDNKTILGFHSVEYQVTDISYESRQLSVVGTEWASEGVCALPSRSRVLSPTTSPFVYLNWGWVTFVNCSEEIAYYGHHPLPCLNRNSSYGFVYVTYTSPPYVGGIRVSCSFLSMVATGTAEESFTNIFQKLHMGFVLTWRRSNNMSITEMILKCLNSTEVVNAVEQSLHGLSILLLPLRIQRPILGCDANYHYYNKRDYVAFQIVAWVLIILMDIALLVIGKD